jgi:hypothetical protein
MGTGVTAPTMLRELFDIRKKVLHPSCMIPFLSVC